MPANTPVQTFLNSSNLATVLTDIANAAVLQRITDGQTAVEDYLHHQNLQKGITNLSLHYHIGTNPALATVLEVTVHTALGNYTVSTCIRTVLMNPHSSYPTVLNTLHALIVNDTVTLSPHQQTLLDTKINDRIRQYKHDNNIADGTDIESLLHGYQLALSLSILKAGAAHTHVSVPVYLHHYLLHASSTSSTVVPSPPTTTVPLPVWPRPSFALVQGNLQDTSTWFVQKYVYLTSGNSSSSNFSKNNYLENLSAFVKAFAGIRNKLGITNTTTHTVDGTLLPLNNPPTNRWASLDEILKIINQESSSGSNNEPNNNNINSSLSIDFNGDKTYLSIETLKKEAEAIAAAEAAYLAAGNKPKPVPKPAPVKPPAKGALPPDPKTLWANEPLTIVLPDGSPSEDGQAKYIMAKPTPEAITAAPNPEAARLTLSSVRYCTVLKDCFHNYPRIGSTMGSLCIDPIDLTDEYSWSLLAKQCKENNLTVRLATRQASKLYGILVSNHSSNGSENIEKIMVEKLGHLTDTIQTVILSFDDIKNITDLIQGYRTLTTILPSSTIGWDHSKYLADTETIESEVVYGLQCTDILLPPPDHNTTINIISRLSNLE